MLERAFEGEGVHHGGEHADVIGGGPVHSPGGSTRAAPEISTADDDAELEAALHGFADFQGDAVDDFGRNIVPGSGSTQCFAAEFEDGALEGSGIFRSVGHA